MGLSDLRPLNKYSWTSGDEIGKLRAQYRMLKDYLGRPHLNRKLNLWKSFDEADINNLHKMSNEAVFVTSSPIDDLKLALESIYSDTLKRDNYQLTFLRNRR